MTIFSSDLVTATNPPDRIVADTTERDALTGLRPGQGVLVAAGDNGDPESWRIFAVTDGSWATATKFQTGVESAGLVGRGTITADPNPAILGSSYSLDSTAAAFDFTLPSATGSQETILLGASPSVATNAVTVRVQSGQSLNDTTDGTFTVDDANAQYQTFDGQAGAWLITRLGADAGTALTSQIDEAGTALTIGDASVGNTIVTSNAAAVAATVDAITAQTGYVRVVNNNPTQTLTFTGGTASVVGDLTLDFGQSAEITYHSSNRANIARLVDPTANEPIFGPQAALIDSAIVSWDMSVTRNATLSSNIFNVLLNDPTNLEAGQVYALDITSTFSLGTNFRSNSIVFNVDGTPYDEVHIPNGTKRTLTFFSPDGTNLVPMSGNREETATGPVVALGDQSPTVWDGSRRNVSFDTAAAARTFGFPSDVKAGELYSAEITSSNAGGTTVTFDAGFVDIDGGALPAAVIPNGQSRQYFWVSIDGTALITVAGSGLDGGDDLGNHTATQALDLADFELRNWGMARTVSSVDISIDGTNTGEVLQLNGAGPITVTTNENLSPSTVAKVLVINNTAQAATIAGGSASLTGDTSIPAFRHAVIYMITDAAFAYANSGSIAPTPLDRAIVSASADVSFQFTAADLAGWDQLDVATGSNVSLASSQITLQPGKRYVVKGHFSMDGDPAANVVNRLGWRLAGGGAITDGVHQVRDASLANPSESAEGQATQPVALLEVTPTSALTFVLRQLDVSSDNHVIRAGGSWIEIEEKPISTVVDPGSITPESLHYITMHGTGVAVAISGQIVDLSATSFPDVQDPNGMLDAANDRVIIQQDGRYSIRYACGESTSSNLSIFINGVEARRFSSVTSTAGEPYLEHIAQLVATDYIEIRDSAAPQHLYSVFIVEQLPTGTIVDPGAIPVTEWTSYGPVTIGATTTAPTKGTVDTEIATYKVVGKTCQVQYYFQQSTAGTAGSGTYLFPMPSGISIDLTKVVADEPGTAGSIVGTASGHSSGNVRKAGIVHVYDADNFWLEIDQANAALAKVGSTSGNTLSLAHATETLISFTADVPIV